MLSQPACQAPPTAQLEAPDPNLRPQARCWPYMGAYDDLGIFCADLDASQKQVPTGYTLHCLKVTYVCDDVISDECVARLGTVGCYNNWASYKKQLTTRQPPGVTLGTNPAPASEDNTAAIIGGVVGGVCGALLIAAVIGALVWRQRRRRQQPAFAERPGDDGAKGPSSAHLVVHGSSTSTSGLAGAGAGAGAAAHGDGAAKRAGGASCWPLGLGGGGQAGRAKRQEALAGFAGGVGDLEYGAPGAVALVRDSSSRTAHGAGGKAGLVGHSDAAGLGSTESKAPVSGASDLNSSARRDSRLHHHLLQPHSNSNGSGDAGPCSGAHERQQAALEQALAASAFNTATGTTFTAGGGSSNADRPDAEATMTTAMTTAGMALDAALPSPLMLSTMGGIDTMEVVTLDTPQMVTISADPRVTLLPAVLGRGAFGRVVEGRYQGQRVAVKILNEMLASGHTDLGGDGDGADDGADLVEPNNTDAHQTAGEGGGAGGEGGEGSGDQAAMPVGGNQLEALVQEVEVLGRCRHQNVVRLLAACVTPPRLCLVMELMETSLERMLYGGGPDRPLLPLDTVLDIALDVAQGLSYLHPTIVHRDLKPGNVLVNLNGGKRPLAKLSDFGLSRIQSTVVITADLEAGTPGYMAPELFDVSNFVISHKVDIYSYGILLWAMLTGKEPWKEYGLVQMTYCVAILQQRPPLPGPERCSDKMRRLIAACWEPHPQRRPAAAEVVKQLLLIKQQQETFSAPTP
ncbi:hypothetical protein HXX76_003321 [Chlamydomonas incerta]|uniref:Protein kinase domain-containing protein n=1 Tax=Chlamydomonas incerta TaxID=51695 RepID=A0A835TMN9_CHLIN|nr:hypothetical protein HXX76_003321 [Chlamydomonas incerta]|eukprot:KAG2441705.1 hypothetical protein HXX76_003321 [Chlamydomonas incerta]